MGNSISSLGYRSNVHFGNGSTDRLSTELMNKPGAYSSTGMTTEEVHEAQEEKGSVLGTAVKVVAGLVIAAGAAYAARKYGVKDNYLKEIKEDTKLVDKAKHYLAKWVDAAESKIKNLFNKAEAPAATTAESKVAEGAAETKSAPLPGDDEFYKGSHL